MEGEGLDVSPESSAGTPDGSAASAPAPSAQVSGDPTQAQQVPYTRFKEVNDGYRQLHAQYAVMQDRYNQLAQQMRAAAASRGSGEPMPEGYDLAGKQLWDLMSRHPQFQQMMQLVQAGPLLATGYQTAQSVQEQAAQRYIADEHSRLGQMAKSAGLPSTEQDVLVLSYQVAGLINGNQQAKNAYLQGDRSVLDRAFAIVRQQYDGHRRAANTALNNNKNAMSRLPPRPAGGPPGNAPTMPKLDPDNPRAYESALHRMAEARLRDDSAA